MPDSITELEQINQTGLVAINSNVATDPSRADVLNSIGAKFFREGQIEAARLHFLASLSLEPNHAMALQNLGAALRQLNHYEAAESVAKRSVVASNGNVFCRSNLGVAQLGLKKYNEALNTLRDVAVDAPEHSHSWHNLGLAYYMMGKYKEALEAFDTSLGIMPDNSQVRSDRALALLSQGDIKLGLEEYEVRWDLLFKSKIWTLNVPEWQGEDLTGKHILVHHEQGFGDSLMLARFIHSLSLRGCQITVAVPQELLRLFEHSFLYANVIEWRDEILETMHFDVHSPLLSVMRHLGVAKPEDIGRKPYLTAKALSSFGLPGAPYKIGICWASGNHGPALTERRRVVPLTLFLPLLEIPEIALISLQKGKESTEIQQHGMEGMVFDISNKLSDFATTADVMQHLDLVISVDSAVAHLAGAIGKPCMMLSPYTRCWRWWSNSRGWPWYEGMSLYHQSQDGSWFTAMAKITSHVRGEVNRYIRK